MQLVFPCHGPGQRAERKFCDRACFTEHQQNQKDARRATGDSRKYDMKPEEYEARLAAQDGLCAICEKKISGKDVHRDHCHTSGEWRGLLCSNCNLGLGNFQENAEILLSAWRYLAMGGVAYEHSTACL